jgi:5'-3' exonuclease
MMKLNLCIDGNYLLQKSVHILHKNKILTSELYNVIERDYLTLTKLYPFDKIYFISDSIKNWRKEFYTEYKGTRKKDTNIDWEFVFKEYTKLKELLQTKRNCVQLQIENLEGDDIISYVIKKLNNKGESTLLMSNDSDLLQLIDYDIDKKYINIMYNYKMNDDRIYMPEHYEIFLNHVKDSFVDDIFEDNNENEFLFFINNFIKTRKVSLINSEMELFTKIMGHNKDNIKSIYMKGDRGIGKSGILKIYNTYKETYPEPIDFNSDNFKIRILDHIKLYKKLKDNSMDESINDRLIRNLTLVKLDEKSMPDDLYKIMKNELAKKSI